MRNIIACAGGGQKPLSAEIAEQAVEIAEKNNKQVSSAFSSFFSAISAVKCFQGCPG